MGLETSVEHAFGNVTGACTHVRGGRGGGGVILKEAIIGARACDALDKQEFGRGPVSGVTNHLLAACFAVERFHSWRVSAVSVGNAAPMICTEHTLRARHHCQENNDAERYDAREGIGPFSWGVHAP